MRRSAHRDRRDALHNTDRREETARERAGRRLHLLRRKPARAIRTGGIPARLLQRGVIILAAIPVLEDDGALEPAPGSVREGGQAAGTVLSGDFQLGNELLPPGDPRFYKTAVILLVAVRREQRAVRQAAHDGVELEIRVLAVAKHNADRVGPLAQQACHVISDIVDGARRVTFAGIEQRIGERRAVERSAEQPQAAHIEARVIHFPERRLEIAGEQRRGGGIALPAVPLADPRGLPVLREQPHLPIGRLAPAAVTAAAVPHLHLPPAAAAGSQRPAAVYKAGNRTRVQNAGIPQISFVSRKLLRRRSHENPAGALQRFLPRFPAGTGQAVAEHRRLFRQAKGIFQPLHAQPFDFHFNHPPLRAAARSRPEHPACESCCLVP